MEIIVIIKLLKIKLFLNSFLLTSSQVACIRRFINIVYYIVYNRIFDLSKDPIYNSLNDFSLKLLFPKVD